MLHIAGIDQLKGPVGHAGVGRHIGIDVDVAQHVFLAGQVLLVDRQRQHDLHHLTGNALGGLCAGIHQDQGVGVAGYDLDIRVGLLVLYRNTAALVVQRGHAAVIAVGVSVCAFCCHCDGGKHGYRHPYADQQGNHPFCCFFFHCLVSSPMC